MSLKETLPCFWRLFLGVWHRILFWNENNREKKSSPGCWLEGGVVRKCTVILQKPRMRGVLLTLTERCGIVLMFPTCKQRLQRYSKKSPCRWYLHMSPKICFQSSCLLSLLPVSQLHSAPPPPPPRKKHLTPTFRGDLGSRGREGGL